jgi:hypothetical protein
MAEERLLAPESRSDSPVMTEMAWGVSASGASLKPPTAACWLAGSAPEALT